MIKVITYGTYDLLHYGHIRLLRRAKALGDYLIVGVTADGFDRARGKINVQQTLMERIEGVKSTGLADEIIIEEYEGQKIDDIKRLGVNIFTVGSDWKGYFDYLNEYCKVVYLERTEGVSSSELRSEEREIKLGFIGESSFLNKFEHEGHYVNGLQIEGICADNMSLLNDKLTSLPSVTDNLEEILDKVDAVYVISNPLYHYKQIKKALEKHKHVLCESPIALSVEEFQQLRVLASKNNCVLMDALRTAYSQAYYHLLLLVKSGVIGNVASVDVTCTSLRNIELERSESEAKSWNSICSWGPTALLPVFQLLGTNYSSKTITSHLINEKTMYDSFTKIDFIYPHAVASLKVGKGVKSEGELIISGTKGYIYVPAPWWKTDYFEVRYEDPAENKRYFYQLDGEGIRYELFSFLEAIEKRKDSGYVDNLTSEGIIKIMEDFYNKEIIKI
jgi:choline-phosphate cytidylyltransferase